MFTPFHRFPGFSEAAQPGFSPSQIFQFLFSRPFISIIQKKCFRKPLPELSFPDGDYGHWWQGVWYYHYKTLSFTQNDWTMRNWIWKIVWTFFGWMSNNFVVCPKGDLIFLFKNSTFCSFCLSLFKTSLFPIRFKNRDVSMGSPLLF